MGVINQYKAIYPLENSFESEIKYINATSMEKAIQMISTEIGFEPKIISRQIDNILTEETKTTTISFEIKSYYKSNDGKIEISKCVAYPTSLNNCVRGSTVYMQSPNTYDFIEDNINVRYTFLKWVYENIEYMDNPQIFTLPLDETITNVTIQAIYEKTII